MSDRIDIILDELREHRKESKERHDLIEERLRSLEETRAHQKGAATATAAIAALISGVISLLCSLFNK